MLTGGANANRRRRGFTLFEVVVAALIIAILAAATVPQVMNALDQKRLNESHAMLLELHYGFTNTAQTGFLNVVRTSGAATTSSTVPGRLSHLSEPIGTLQQNSCGPPGPVVVATGSYNATAVTTWGSFGPFISRVVTAGGLSLPIGRISDTLLRTPAWPGVPAWIQMQIFNVDSIDAYNLDVLVDGAPSTTSGTIQYTVTTGVATVTYRIPVVNRC